MELPSDSADVDGCPPTQACRTTGGAPVGSEGGRAQEGGDGRSTAPGGSASDQDPEAKEEKQEEGEEGEEEEEEDEEDEEDDEEEKEEKEEEESGGNQVDSAGGRRKKPAATPLRLVDRANVHFRRAKYAEAIRLYSQAIVKHQRTVPQALDTPASPYSPQSPQTLLLLLLSNRSAAFCSLSQQLRSIPAAQSERRALFGLDPLSLAELALRDADKLIKDGGATWPKAYYRRACALIQLEKYPEARDAFLSGLQVDPSCSLLQNGLRELKADRNGGGSGAVLGNPGSAPSLDPAGGGAGPSRGRGPPGGEPACEAGVVADVDLPQGKRRAIERTDEFDCSLCLKLLFAPVTTPCGHTFCRSCLARAVDHGNKCPVCRIPLFVNPSSQPVTVVLNNILEKFFPEEYQERKAEADAEKALSKETIPLFVMDVVLPRQKMALNIFEPRYRLMIRRCMEGNRRMGMVGFDHSTRDIADVACEVEICECEPQPDGRFHLEVEGRRRFKVLRSWDLDGYRMAQVEWLKDTEVDKEADPEGAAQLAALSEEASTTAKKWIEDILRSAKGARKMRLTEYIRSAGDMPSTSLPEGLSFWIANLLPTHPRDRLHFLRMTSTAERLSYELNLLRTPDRFSSCLVQ